MSRNRDPRRVQGSISDSDDPYGIENVLVDVTDALLLEAFTVSLVGTISKGLPEEDVLAMELKGRINKTEERISVLCLTNADGAAALVSQLIGLASRAGWRNEFMELVQKRIEEMPK